ncbi:arylsulfatase [Pedobacter frigidisoli]|uniref:arylsulfatase n=1 Tax=Pedobacter frigidisoli TaxID=2530455 RepID=UPI00292E10B1|nr:arylsulfatase [Pedobacter frigidisoli]
MKNSFLILLALTLINSFNTNAQKKQHPNIILILADDLGHSDIGAYGSEIQTPNLDKLANQGIRLKEFYNNSICAPTRASLLTGQYQHKAGVGYFANDLGLPAYQGYLNKESLTLAEVLKSNGYTTLLSGKWHVSGKDQSFPWQRGFDRSLMANNGSYFDQGDFNGGKKQPYMLDGKPYPLEAGKFYQTDVVTEQAVTYIAEEAKKDKPFFLYLAYTAPHWPLHALPEDIAKYKGKYDKGWDELRKTRFAKQKQLGIVADNTTPSVKNDDIYDWSKLSYDQRHQWATKMEVFSAMVDRMDQGIGKVLEQLKKSGADQNTLIVFISDNGAPAEEMIKWHNGAIRNTGPVGTIGSYESQSKNWSYASNTPFLAFKDDMYEGGISSPFIAWFPSKIKAGQIRKGTGHIIDLAPTFYELSGAAYPKKFNQTVPNALPGKSLLPVLFSKQDTVQRNEPLFWERAGNRAVRSGKWKLVSHWPSYSWELYNLENDRGETQNLAAKNHELVSQLSVKYFDWAKKTGVVDFSTLEDKEPQSMKDFRKSKIQDPVGPSGFGF